MKKTVQEQVASLMLSKEVMTPCISKIFVDAVSFKQCSVFQRQRPFLTLPLF